VSIEYRMQWGRFENLKARLQALGLSGKLNTAFVERVQKPAGLLPRKRLCLFPESSHYGKGSRH
jgi:hypothetical protein